MHIQQDTVGSSYTAQNPRQDIGLQLLASTVEGLFQSNQQQPVQDDADIFEAMENFLDAPLQEDSSQEPQETPTFADLIARIIYAVASEFFKQKFAK